MTPHQPRRTRPLLSFDGLSLTDRGRDVFTDVSLELAAGTLGVVHGPAGSGRSCVLLAASGRVRGLQGAGRLAGLDLVTQARAVRRRSAVARISDVVDLEPQLTVAESITERSLSDAVSAAAAERAVARVEALLDCRFLRESDPDLDPLDQGRLALALSGVRACDLIVFDDVDRALDPDDQRVLYRAMTAVAATGPAVLASTNTAQSVPDHAVVVPLGDQEI